MEKLKACPFCGSTNVEISPYGGAKAVACMDCFCRSEIFEGENAKEKAIVAWNRRATSENKVLTLEQLRQMNGNPAYVKNIVHPDCTGWKVCGGSFDGYFYFSNGETYELSHYGQTWLAYARKPEGSEKK